MQTEKKKICVIGLGYIGLPTAALISNLGYEVVGVDINQSTVDTVNSGNVHIVEPDLDKYVQNSVLSNNLKAYELNYLFKNRIAFTVWIPVENRQSSIRLASKICSFTSATTFCADIRVCE